MSFGGKIQLNYKIKFVPITACVTLSLVRGFFMSMVSVIDIQQMSGFNRYSWRVWGVWVKAFRCLTFIISLCPNVYAY